MPKYLQIIKNTWSEITTYRLNFILWRLRRVVSLLLIYFLWYALLAVRKQAFGYTQGQMLTYVLVSDIVGSFVFATRTMDVGDEINSGDLSNYLLKPLNYFTYWWAKDVADKAMNIIFSFIEVILIIVLLKPPILIQTNFLYLSLFFISLVLGTILYFYISFLLGLVGFWSPETWAPRFLYFTLNQFMVGALFPLDILPKWLFNLLGFLPFPHLMYLPLKIYLGQLDFLKILTGFGLALFWILVLNRLNLFVWKKGLSVYTASGR